MSSLFLKIISFLFKKEESQTVSEELQQRRETLTIPSPRQFRYSQPLPKKARKANWRAFEKIIQEQDINVLYHFTDRSNVDSIREYEGLYSWWYCEQENIPVPCPGGSATSHMLDRWKGLQDYVRLAFCSNHPMLFICMRERRIVEPIILETSPEVIYWQETLFSDVNAADNSAVIGGGLDDFLQIDFDIACSEDFLEDKATRKRQQAEVLVKRHIPLTYILNL